MASKKLNTVRINAGEWRSRQIKFPEIEGLRPTPERVRQTVFNWLGQDLTSQTCLDLFAGTGVMGFEALSRNAAAVTMIEKAKPAYQALLQNKNALKAEAAEILQMDALQYCQRAPKRFDVIFCDPPFHQGFIEKLLPSLIALLVEDGIVYVEAEFALDSADVDGFANTWQILKQKKAGNVHYHLLQRLAAND